MRIHVGASLSISNSLGSNCQSKEMMNSRSFLFFFQVCRLERFLGCRPWDVPVHLENIRQLRVFFPRPYDKTQTFNESIRARLKTSVRYRLARARALRRIRNTKVAWATSTGNLACGYFSKFFPRLVGRRGKGRRRLWSGWVA